jgi:hypothetical protein
MVKGLEAASTDKDIVLQANGFSVTLAKRLAGGVYRLDWKGHNIIPELEGNGGSLQTALAFDVPIGESAEVENPTEAGNHRDNYGKTSSLWKRAARSKTAAFTETRMAYYYPPGDPVKSSPKGSKGRGLGVLSDVVLQKRVDIGWAPPRTRGPSQRTRMDPNVLHFSLGLRWKQPHHFVQVQILAVYLARDFDKIYLVKAGKAVSHVDARTEDNDLVSISPPQTAYPIVLAKSDDVAVGLYAHTVPDRGRFKPTWQPWYTCSYTAGHKDKGKGLEKVDLTAISAVWHAGSQTDTARRIPKAMCFECSLVFGSVAEVAASIGRISDGTRPAN